MERVTLTLLGGSGYSAGGVGEGQEREEEAGKRKERSTRRPGRREGQEESYPYKPYFQLLTTTHEDSR